MTIWVTWSSPFESSFSRQFFVKAKRLPLSRPPRHTSSLWLQVSEQPISMEEKLLIRLNKVFHITVMWELIPLLVCNALRQSRKQPSIRCWRQGICPLHIQNWKGNAQNHLTSFVPFRKFWSLPQCFPRWSLSWQFSGPGRTSNPPWANRTT